MKTSIINGSEVSRLSVAIQSCMKKTHSWADVTLQGVLVFNC